MNNLRSLEIATFRRGATTHSTIDYIYLSLDMSINYVDADVEFLNFEWTDHTLLQKNLASMLTRLYDEEVTYLDLSPQDLWDMVKGKVKQFTRRFGRQHVDWRKQQIVALQRKRQRLLRGPFPSSRLATHLPRVEQQTQILQQEITSIAILKAERTWRERGETDAGYLKKVRHLTTGSTIHTSATKSRNPDYMLVSRSYAGGDRTVLH
ncbi:hypothetical protein G6F43_007333 [Rhizopus delemar]|nr:hypothetical protein G6F43_007333 [Rhizopus delemar]